MKRKDRVNFLLKDGSYIKGTVVSIIGLNDALKIDPNIYAINDALVTYLGLTPESLVEEDFYVIRNLEESIEVYGYSWIDLDSVVIDNITLKNLNLTIPSIDETTINYVLSFLQERGISFNKELT